MNLDTILLDFSEKDAKKKMLGHFEMQFEEHKFLEE